MVSTGVGNGVEAPERKAPRRRPPRREARKRLDRALERVLSSAMGVRFPRAARRLTPFTAAIIWLAGYAVVGPVFVFLVNSDAPSDRRLVSLLAWGGLYCAAALYLARSATVRIRETVERDIIPHVSNRYIDAVAGDLEKHYRPSILHLVALAIAAVALAAAWWALSREIAFPDDPAFWRYPGELIFWLLTYGLHFYGAAVAVIAAGFYSCFAAHLEEERASFYVLGAAETPVVRGLERLSTQVLIFWSQIFILVLSSLLLAVVPPDSYRLAEDSAFLFTLIPIAGFFSLGVGTLTHLSTDARIRAVLNRFTRKQAAALQSRSGLGFDPAAGRIPADKTETETLTGWHDRIIAGGRYGSRTGTSISIALPLVLPVVGLLVELFG